MTLCTYSKSSVYSSEVLTECPLSLNQSSAKCCTCRKREDRPTQTRKTKVLVCCYPRLWNGEEIKSESALVSSIEDKAKAKRKNAKPSLQRKDVMATATTTQEKNGEQTGTAIANVMGGNNAPAVYKKVADPQSFCMILGKALLGGGMLGVTNQEQGFVMALECLTSGQTPSQIERKHHIIGGKLSMKADAMLAEFHLLGGKSKIVERSSGRAAIELTYQGQKVLFEFTWEEAQQEPFVWSKQKIGSSIAFNYSTPRKRMQMLWARVVSDGIRAICPEVNCGQYTPEECSDIDGVAVAEEDQAVDAEFEVKSEPEVGPVETEQEVAPVTESEPMVVKSQLQRMKQLKDQAKIDTDKWKRVIAKVQPDAKSAHALTKANGNRIIDWLLKQVNPEPQSEVAQWAETAATSGK